MPTIQKCYGNAKFYCRYYSSKECCLIMLRWLWMPQHCYILTGQMFALELSRVDKTGHSLWWDLHFHLKCLHFRFGHWAFFIVKIVGRSIGVTLNCWEFLHLINGVSCSSWVRAWCDMVTWPPRRVLGNYCFLNWCDVQHLVIVGVRHPPHERTSS